MRPKRAAWPACWRVSTVAGPCPKCKALPGKGTAGRITIRPVEAGQGDSTLAARAACDRPEIARRVLLAGKIGRGLESAAQDPRAKRRGAGRRVPIHALRTVGELERGWWKASA